MQSGCMTSHFFPEIDLPNVAITDDILSGMYTGRLSVAAQKFRPNACFSLRFEPNLPSRTTRVNPHGIFFVLIAELRKI